MAAGKINKKTRPKKTSQNTFWSQAAIASACAAKLHGIRRHQAGRPKAQRQIHTTVLHVINKVDEMCRSDKALDHTITQLMGAVVP